MAKYEEGNTTDHMIQNWMRSREIIEFLGIWEQINNPDFNYGEFTIIKSYAGLNNYKLSDKYLNY